jgi:hypothetical protein
LWQEKESPKVIISGAAAAILGEGHGGRLAGLYGAFALHIVCTVMEWLGENG